MTLAFRRRIQLLLLTYFLTYLPDFGAIEILLLALVLVLVNVTGKLSIEVVKLYNDGVVRALIGICE